MFWSGTPQTPTPILPQSVAGSGGLVRWPPGPSPVAWWGMGGWKALQQKGPQWNGNRNRKIPQEPGESVWVREPLVLSPAEASEASRRHSQSCPTTISSAGPEDTSDLHPGRSKAGKETKQTPTLRAIKAQGLVQPLWKAIQQFFEGYTRSYPFAQEFRS